MKHYHTTNATVPVAGKFSFTPYGVFGGATFGIYQTDNEGEIAVISQVLNTNGVTEIDAAEYAKCQKKTPRNSAPRLSSDGMRNPLLQQRAEPPLEGNGAVVVAAVPVVESTPEITQPADLATVEQVPQPRRGRKPRE